jgi:hypothetical protein
MQETEILSARKYRYYYYYYYYYLCYIIYSNQFFRQFQVHIMCKSEVIFTKGTLRATTYQSESTKRLHVKIVLREGIFHNFPLKFPPSFQQFETK